MPSKTTKNENEWHWLLVTSKFWVKFHILLHINGYITLFYFIEDFLERYHGKYQCLYHCIISLQFLVYNFQDTVEPSTEHWILTILFGKVTTGLVKIIKTKVVPKTSISIITRYIKHTGKLQSILLSDHMTSKLKILKLNLNISLNFLINFENIDLDGKPYYSK